MKCISFEDLQQVFNSRSKRCKFLKKDAHHVNILFHTECMRDTEAYYPNISKTKPKQHTHVGECIYI